MNDKNTSGLDRTKHPQTFAFLERFDRERAEGLRDLKFFAKDTSEVKLEQFFQEVNQVLSADTIQNVRID